MREDFGEITLALALISLEIVGAIGGEERKCSCLRLVPRLLKDMSEALEFGRPIRGADHRNDFLSDCDNLEKIDHPQQNVNTLRMGEKN